MHRAVAADDPADLESPLHYDVEVTQEHEGIGYKPAKGEPPNKGRVRRALEGSTRLQPTTVRGVGDALAADKQGPPLTKVTIQKWLDELKGDGAANSEDGGGGTTAYWWLKDTEVNA
jgi:hypothetical protein